MQDNGSPASIVPAAAPSTLTTLREWGNSERRSFSVAAGRRIVAVRVNGRPALVKAQVVCYGVELEETPPLGSVVEIDSEPAPKKQSVRDPDPQ